MIVMEFVQMGFISNLGEDWLVYREEEEIDSQSTMIIFK
jgi:hypothetical protein